MSHLQKIVKLRQIFNHRRSKTLDEMYSPVGARKSVVQKELKKTLKITHKTLENTNIVRESSRPIKAKRNSDRKIMPMYTDANLSRYPDLSRKVRNIKK